jgi:thiol-disulfide isomerase/thioredoxin
MKTLILLIPCLASVAFAVDSEEDRRAKLNRDAPAASPAKTSDVISYGAEIEIAEYVALGKVTIVDFYANWCGPCRLVSPPLERLAQTDSEIALRKIDIVNWDSPVAMQYHVNVLPQVNVYNRKGALTCSVRGVDVETIQRCVAQAKSGG